MKSLTGKFLSFFPGGTCTCLTKVFKENLIKSAIPFWLTALWKQFIEEFREVSILCFKK